MDTNALAQIGQVAASASSQASMNAIIIAVLGFFTALVGGVVTIILAKINKVQKDVVEVKETGLQIHGMVNEPFGLALEDSAKALEMVANMNPDRADYKQAAATARTVSDDHKSTMAAFKMAQRVAEAAKAKVTVVSKPEAVAVKVEPGATVLVIDPKAAENKTPPVTAEEVNQRLKTSSDKLLSNDKEKA